MTHGQIALCKARIRSLPSKMEDMIDQKCGGDSAQSTSLANMLLMAVDGATASVHPNQQGNLDTNVVLLAALSAAIGGLAGAVVVRKLLMQTGGSYQQLLG